jgi:hypothetical protein
MIKWRAGAYVLLVVGCVLLLAGVGFGVWALAQAGYDYDPWEEAEMPAYFVESAAPFPEAVPFQFIVHEFSPDNSILAADEIMFIVAVQDDFITIFYAPNDKEGIRVKEVTNIPVSPLPREEQERLTRGILVSSEEELWRLLEDYGS